MLTTEQIAALEQGREMDIAVAEMLTGQSRLECRQDPMNRNGEPQFHWGYPHGHDFAPAYSTDIGAAWAILDKLTLPSIKQLPDGRWQVVCLVRREPELVTASASADTAPMAICLVALNASRAALAAVKGEDTQ